VRKGVKGHGSAGTRGSQSSKKQRSDEEGGKGGDKKSSTEEKGKTLGGGRGKQLISVSGDGDGWIERFKQNFQKISLLVGRGEEFRRILDEKNKNQTDRKEIHRRINGGGTGGRKNPLHGD